MAKHTLTPDDIAAYVAAGGIYCPFCRAAEFDGAAVDIDGPSAAQEVTCDNCGAVWIDYYRLNGFQVAQAPNQSKVATGLTLVLLAQGESVGELLARLDEIARDIRKGTYNARRGDDFDYQINCGLSLDAMTMAHADYYRNRDDNQGVYFGEDKKTDSSETLFGLALRERVKQILPKLDEDAVHSVRALFTLEDGVPLAVPYLTENDMRYIVDAYGQL